MKEVQIGKGVRVAGQHIWKGIDSLGMMTPCIPGRELAQAKSMTDITHSTLILSLSLGQKTPTKKKTTK